ncbi:hypothetical protein U8V72_11425 [Priestia filamentosa]|uniref:hypothetical protein n=1 Tax=Priestia filamentosa TaxID=1402861 RepID=UPI00397CA8DA
MTKRNKKEEEKIFEKIVKERLAVPLAAAKKFFKLQLNKDGSIKQTDGEYKLEGKQLAVKLNERDAYSPEVIEWILKQDNFNNSVKYLIEQDVANYGPRNIGEHVPQARDLKDQLKRLDTGEESIYQLYKNGPRDTNTSQAKTVISKPMTSMIHETPQILSNTTEEEKQVVQPPSTPTEVEEKVGNNVVVEKTVSVPQPEEPKAQVKDEIKAQETNMEEPASQNPLNSNTTLNNLTNKQEEKTAEVKEETVNIKKETLKVETEAPKAETDIKESPSEEQDTAIDESKYAGW